MRRSRAAFAALFAAATGTAAWAADAGGSGFDTIVGPDGAITLEGYDYRRGLVFLGSWAVNDEDGVHELHQVYTQPATIDAYLATGAFSDGAVLVKELQGAETGEFTTGRVGHYGAPAGWFVMVRDTRGRFAGHPLWGEGWGWAQFDAGAPAVPITDDYEAECLGCHEPARDTGLVYVEGYPLLAGGD